MRIEIDKNKIPYVFTFKSGSEVYLLRIKHFKSNNRIYIDVLDEDGEMLLENEKLVYGRPVGWSIAKDENDNINNEFLNCYIVPLSFDKKEVPITFENFCETIFLEYFDIFEPGEENV
jgi:hypothetical protein